MATVDLRWAICQKIVSLLRESNALTGVTIEPGWPGDRGPNAQLIWIGDIDGTCEIPVMTAGRKQRDEKFDITVDFRIAGFGTLDEVGSRISEVFTVAGDILVDDCTLDNFDGVLSAEMTRKSGPSLGMFPEGPVGFGQFVISVSTRLL